MVKSLPNQKVVIHYPDVAQLTSDLSVRLLCTTKRRAVIQFSLSFNFSSMFCSLSHTPYKHLTHTIEGWHIECDSFNAFVNNRDFSKAHKTQLRWQERYISLCSSFGLMKMTCLLFDSSDVVFWQYYEREKTSVVKHYCVSYALKIISNKKKIAKYLLAFA